jgi:hypothetical protein
LQGEDVMITFSVDGARASIWTLHRSVDRHDEVAAHPAAVLWCGIPVELEQVGLSEISGIATVGAEDQLHRTIVARQIVERWVSAKGP